MARPFLLVAVDTNFLLDLAVPRDKAHDMLEVFRRRVPEVEFVVVPTVIDELDYMAQHGDTPSHRSVAASVLKKLVRVWKFRPLDFIPVGHGIIESVARKLHGTKLIPERGFPVFSSLGLILPYLQGIGAVDGSRMVSIPSVQITGRGLAANSAAKIVLNPKSDTEWRFDATDFAAISGAVQEEGCGSSKD